MFGLVYAGKTKKAGLLYLLLSSVCMYTYSEYTNVIWLRWRYTAPIRYRTRFHTESGGRTTRRWKQLLEAVGGARRQTTVSDTSALRRYEPS